MRPYIDLFGVNRPFIIAEISGNHMKDDFIFKETLIAAKESGADMIKIQIFTPDHMVVENQIVENPKSPWHGKSYRELYQKTSLPPPMIDLFFDWCRQNKMDGFASVFHPAIAEMIDLRYDPPYFKVASPEVNHWPLLETLAKIRKPTIVSLGAATALETAEAVDIFQAKNAPLILMHCVSEYPPDTLHLNLSTIALLREMYPHIPIGYSDHTLGITAAIGAVAYGARMIEKHFILDKTMDTPDASFSSDPEEFQKLVKAAKEMYFMAGRPTLYREGEEPGRTWKRSVWYKNDDYEILRPNNGLHPRTVRYLKRDSKPSGAE